MRLMNDECRKVAKEEMKKNNETTNRRPFRSNLRVVDVATLIATLTATYLCASLTLKKPLTN